MLRITHASPVSRARRERLARVVWGASAVTSWAVAFALANVSTVAGALGAGMFAVFGLAFTLRAMGR